MNSTINGYLLSCGNMLDLKLDCSFLVKEVEMVTLIKEKRERFFR